MRNPRRVRAGRRPRGWPPAEPRPAECSGPARPFYPDISDIIHFPFTALGAITGPIRSAYGFSHFYAQQRHPMDIFGVARLLNHSHRFLLKNAIVYSLTVMYNPNGVRDA